MNYHTKPTISILLSGIRVENFTNIYRSCQAACGKHTFELVIVSPKFPPTELAGIENIKYLVDYGSPARCLQLASYLAEGQFIISIYDDGVLEPENLGLAVDSMLEQDEKTIMAIIYTEGHLNDVQNDPRIINPEHFFALRSHPDQSCLVGIPEGVCTAIFFLMNRQDWYKYGGIDCSCETINFNVHDLHLRMKKEGYQIVFSPRGKPIQNLGHEPNRQPNNPIISATFNNDYPWYTGIYGNMDSTNNRPVVIDFDNWRKQPAVWPRR